MKKILTVLLAAFLLLPAFAAAFPAAAETAISAVELTNVREPLADDTFSYFVYCRTSGCDVSSTYGANAGGFQNGVAWYDQTAGRYVKAGETAVFGHKYVLYTYVRANAGYVLATKDNKSTVAATVNKAKADVVDFSSAGFADSAKEILVRYEFPACARKTITSLTATIPAPAAMAGVAFDADGDYEDYVLDVGYNNHGFEKGIRWYQLKQGAGGEWSEVVRTLDDTDVFLPGSAYRLYMRFKARPGREFAVRPDSQPDMTGLLNGKKAYMLRVDDSMTKDVVMLMYEFTSLAVNTVGTVSLVSLVEPVGGQAPDMQACTPADRTYELVSLQWTDSTEKALTSVDKFVEGQKYTLTATVAAVKGCELALGSSLSVYVNGRKMKVISGSKTGVTASYTFTAGLSKTITSVAVTGAGTPVAGEKPGYSLTVASPTAKCQLDAAQDSTQYGIKNGVQWTDGLGSPLKAGDAFANGGLYKVTAFLQAKSGFEFAGADTTVTIDGIPATVESDFVSDTEIWATVEFKQLPKTKTYDVGVSLTAPVAGQKPAAQVTSASPAYRVSSQNGVYWIDRTTGEKVTAAFAPGHAYRAYVALLVNEGYELADVLSCTVNGKPCSYSYEQAGLLSLTYDFDELAGGDKKITKVTLDGTFRQGVTLTDKTFTTKDAGVASVSTAWDYNGHPLASGSQAKAGQYMAEITLKAADGYVFSPDAVVQVLGGSHSFLDIADGGKTGVFLTGALNLSDCTHEHFKYEQDAAGHWKVCLDCFEILPASAHTFDGGKADGTGTVYTCTVCGYEKRESGERRGVQVILPELNFPKTLGDVCRETVVECTAGDPAVISYTFRTQEETETILYHPDKHTWALAGGGDPAPVMEQRLLAFTEYTLTIEIDTGKQITDDDISVQNPDQRAMRCEAASRLGTIAVIEAVYMTGSNYISTIDLDDVAAPVAGQMPSDSFHVTLAEGLEGVSLTWNTKDAFVCGESYVATIVVRTTDGYVFAAEVTAMVEGCPDVKVTEIKDGVATVKCTYPPVAHLPGQDGTCTVCGQAVDGQTQPTGSRPAAENGGSLLWLWISLGAAGAALVAAATVLLWRKFKK
ncbi:MAG: hypothetical protein IKI50_03590 [Clostridia bacterium]|nr:hypothetical protein [Clostridia bacterium]